MGRKGFKITAFYFYLHFTQRPLEAGSYCDCEQHSVFVKFNGISSSSAVGMHAHEKTWCKNVKRNDSVKCRKNPTSLEPFK